MNDLHSSMVSGTWSSPVLAWVTQQSVPDRLDCFYKSVLVASKGGSVSGSSALH